jgi:hypothetical protein
MHLSSLARVAGQALLAGIAVCGCEREAPGPQECVSFADAWFRSPRFPVATRLGAEKAYADLVRHCLTEPYDRELVACVVGGRPQENCRVDYARRVEARRTAP